MHKKTRLLIALAVLVIFSLKSKAQAIDWSAEVASIIYKNCSSCHHEGGMAPFSLTSYEDAVDYALSIQNVVNAGVMPPWPADPDYRHFAYEAVLDDDEINAINQWVNNGAPAGNLNLAPPPPVFANNGSLLQTIDFTVAIEPYTLQYNTDEYRWFVVSNPYTDTIYINQIEVFSGLDSIVHHADISYDVTGNSLQYDLMDPLPGFNSNTGWPTYSYYMNAWQPGGNIVTYPENWGIAVPPSADFVLEIHYGPGGQGLIDSTIMNLRFVTNIAAVRPVHVQWILYDSPPCLTDGPLAIPANTVQTFHQKSSPMPVDRSLISICPHQHHLGKSYRVWFETTDGDSVPLIDIPQWSFYWQKYYTFRQIQKIPQGARIKSEAIFDNTVNNPDNPSNPPIDVEKGSTTMDEMLLCYFIYADYEPGDENIILDTTLVQTGTSQIITQQEAVWETYPSPITDLLFIKNNGDLNKNYTATIYNIMGTKVFEELMPADPITTINVSGFAGGVYFIYLSDGSHLQQVKFIKQ